MRPGPGSRIDIDGDALQTNLRALQSELAPTRLVMVVKANAYGHGIDPVVPLAMQAGIDEFAVFSIREASRVLDVAPTAHVQVMGHVGRQWDWIAQTHVQPWLADIAEWPAARRAAQAAVAAGNAPMRVHVEVETGMHRTGLVPENAFQVIEEAAKEPAIDVVGLCTHLAGAEDQRNASRIEAQMQIFSTLTDRIRDAGYQVPARHVASSSAALVHPAWRLDAVRVGIASYGLWPTPEVRARYHAETPDPIRLDQVMTWRSTIMAIQDVPAGAHVGYGASFQTTRSSRVAIVPVGYSDGLTRRLSNAGHLLVQGQRCPIVGPVNMNMVQIDISHLPQAQPGDDVVLIGAQGEERISVHSFAEGQEVVDYEFMARLDKDIPRVALAPPMGPGN